MTPVFLSLAEVLEIHQDQLEHYGGKTGIRDIALLKSAIGMPSARFGTEFLHHGIYDMAAAYIFHIVNNHPFTDGNKRTGAVAGLVFLALNGYDFDAPEDDFAEMILSTARGETDKSEIAIFLRKWSRKLQ